MPEIIEDAFDLFSIYQQHVRTAREAAALAKAQEPRISRLLRDYPQGISHLGTAYKLDAEDRIVTEPAPVESTRIKLDNEPATPGPADAEDEVPNAPNDDAQAEFVANINKDYRSDRDRATARNGFGYGKLAAFSPDATKGNTTISA